MGDQIAVLTGKRFELVVSLMAIWRLGAVHVPLFTAFAAPRSSGGSPPQPATQRRVQRGFSYRALAPRPAVSGR